MTEPDIARDESPVLRTALEAILMVVDEPVGEMLLAQVTERPTDEVLAALAARALAPKPVEELSLAHLHAPTVSVREQAVVVVDRLRRAGTMTFRALSGDAADTLTTVARFLALLELFREGAVSFDQVIPLGELTVRWTGDDEDDAADSLDSLDGIDEFEGTGTAS